MLQKNNKHKKHNISDDNYHIRIPSFWMHIIRTSCHEHHLMNIKRLVCRIEFNHYTPYAQASRTIGHIRLSPWGWFQPHPRTEHKALLSLTGQTPLSPLPKGKESLETVSINGTAQINSLAIWGKGRKEDFFGYWSPGWQKHGNYSNTCVLYLV